MSRRKPGKIVGMRAAKSARAPHCSVHMTDKHMRRDPGDNWFCAECADEHLRHELETRSRKAQEAGLSLVALPPGVIDPRVERATFRDVLPNRAARRAARRLT